MARALRSVHHVAAVTLALLLAAAPAAGVRAQGDEGLSLHVERIVTDPSEILADAELRALAAPYEGREVTLEELRELVNAINAAYAAKGYLTARAFLPPQAVSGGVVRIQLVEGRVGELRVEGNAHTKSRYVLDRLTLVGGDLLDIEKLRREIVAFNLAHDVQIRADLRPGEAFGTTDVLLVAVEPANVTTQIFADTGGTRESGIPRLGLDWQNRSLAGFRDTLSVGVTLSEGARTGTLAYEFPVDTSGVRLRLGRTYSHTRIIEGAFAGLDMSTEQSGTSLRLARPLTRELQRKATFTVELQKATSTTAFSGVPLVTHDTTSVDAGLELDTRSEETAYSLCHSLRMAYVDSDTARSTVTSYRGSARIERPLPPDRRIVYRGRLFAAAGVDVPDSELFQLGGGESIRGYSSGAASGRYGFEVSAEVHWPAARGGRLVFVDYGRAYAGNAAHTLASVGMGIEHYFSAGAVGRLIISFPLKEAITAGDRLISASLQVTF